MDVVSTGMWRYPEASARLFGGEFWVECSGHAEEVLPRGVLRDGDLGNVPTRLRASLRDVVEDLKVTATHASDADASTHLVRHVARFGAPDFCGAHGLPRWHDGNECTPGGLGSSRHVAVRLADVRRFINFLDGIQDATEQLSGQRRPLRRRAVEDILSGGLTPAVVRDIARDEMAALGALSLPRARQLIRTSVDQAIKASGLSLSTRWPNQRRPQLALVAWSTVALYFADLVIGLGQPGGSLACSVCGLPFTPKRHPRQGDGLYCGRVECQQRRLSTNQAAYRARKKVGM